MSRFVRPHVAAMAGYQPGEQPRGGGFIKLNTNENPYPPSPEVAKAVAAALDGRLRLYPDPVGTAFREAAARLHGVGPEMVLVGNGSDDVLTILTRACAGPGDVVAAPSPSYILYRTLAELQDARFVEVPFRPDWTLDPDAFAAARPRLAFLANPNSPSGTRLAPESVGDLARRLEGPLVVDEAYADFASGDCVGLLREHANVVVTRSLSKGYGLAGLRVGYLLARPEFVAELVKVKDSYNCDSLSLVGGAAALEDRAHFGRSRALILATRARLTASLRGLGFAVTESEANFVWCAGHPRAVGIYEALKERKILVRLMRYDGLPPGLRVTVGTDDQIDRLLAELRTILDPG